MTVNNKTDWLGLCVDMITNHPKKPHRANH